jgi:glycerol-3-phosphate acyltransferase PlsY
MIVLIWIMIAFIAGSIPTSVWLGKTFLKLDIRQYGDGNPGATNVFRAGSPVLGVITLFSDISKAAIPVGFCYHNLNLRGVPMLLISVAPVLGHMFSPFLGFKGGKALAATLGVWIGLTIWQASIPAALGAVIGILFLSTPGWSMMLAMLFILLSLIIFDQEPLFYGTWIFLTVLLSWAHKMDLTAPPGLNQRIKKIFQ